MQTRGAAPYLLGATDGTLIGNSGDRLKVDATAGTISQKFRADYSTAEMIILGFSYITFYSYSGTGLFWGFQLNMDQDGGQIQLIVDGNVIFQDITSKTLNDLGLGVSREFHSRGGAGTYGFYFPSPLAFNSSVTLAAKRDTGGTVKIQQRIIYITKET